MLKCHNIIEDTPQLHYLDILKLNLTFLKYTKKRPERIRNSAINTLKLCWYYFLSSYKLSLVGLIDSFD